MYNPPDHYVMPFLPSGSMHDVRGIPREFNHEYSTLQGDVGLSTGYHARSNT